MYIRKFFKFVTAGLIVKLVTISEYLVLYIFTDVLFCLHVVGHTRSLRYSAFNFIPPFVMSFAIHSKRITLPVNVTTWP